MILSDGNQILVAFGKGTLVLMRGKLASKGTKLLGIKDSNEKPKPLGEFKDIDKKFSIEKSENIFRIFF